MAGDDSYAGQCRHYKERLIRDIGLQRREEKHLSNIEIDAPLVDGRLKLFYENGATCWDAVTTLIGNDFETPPTSLNFTVQTLSGKTVKLVIPYDRTAVAKVYIDDKIV